MQVILLEKVGKLGDLGDVVKVKQGYARNYLIPTKQARRATESALSRREIWGYRNAAVFQAHTLKDAAGARDTLALGEVPVGQDAHGNLRKTLARSTPASASSASASASTGWKYSR